MTWAIDYFLICSKCGENQFMDGRTKAIAKATAIQKGWQLSPDLCPKCVKEKSDA